MALMAKDHYDIEHIMSKIDEELHIQQINLEASELDQIRNLLEHIFQQHK